ncbi:MAG: type IV pili methyl-accepting chemotaxis transducer N-terminal domain-containing protein [Rhodobacteraceae bacterium]|nr:type IV pili methyl-accepting chemotaxis transducer N-terminal domain-containing protein [Paracoccaceae bacterium]
MKFFPSFIAIGTISILFLTGNPILPTTASAETLDQALVRINVSARQRMLAQRMAGLSCLVYLDIEAETHARDALDTRDLFAQSLSILQFGGGDSGLDIEAHSKIISDIAKAKRLFDRLSGYLDVLSSSGTIETDRLQAISSVSNSLFEVSDVLTNDIQSIYSSEIGNLPLIRTMILNFAGRQRMLSEKAFKEFCLSQAGIDTQIKLASLEETVRIFENTLTALINGMPGLIIAPPTTEIRDKLEEAGAVWSRAKVVLDRAIAGEIFEAEDILSTSQNLVAVRILMNEAVLLYGQVDTEG